MRRTRHLMILLAAVALILLPTSPAHGGQVTPMTVEQVFEATAYMAANGTDFDGGFHGMQTGEGMQDSETFDPGVSGISWVGAGFFDFSPNDVVDLIESGDLPANVHAVAGDRAFGADFPQTFGFLVRLEGPWAVGQLQEAGVQFYSPVGVGLLPDPFFPYGVGEGITSLTAFVESAVQSGSIFGQTDESGQLEVFANGYSGLRIAGDVHTDLVFFGPVAHEWAGYNSGAAVFDPADGSTFENLGAQITERQPVPETLITDATLTQLRSNDAVYASELARFFRQAGIPVPPGLPVEVGGEEVGADGGGAVPSVGDETPGDSTGEDEESAAVDPGTGALEETDAAVDSDSDSDVQSTAAAQPDSDDEGGLGVLPIVGGALVVGVIIVAGVRIFLRDTSPDYDDPTTWRRLGGASADPAARRVLEAVEGAARARGATIVDGRYLAIIAADLDAESVRALASHGRGASSQSTGADEALWYLSLIFLFPDGPADIFIDTQSEDRSVLERPLQPISMSEEAIIS